MHVATLAERDHPVHVRTDRFRLRQRRLDALFHDQGGHQVAQQCATVLRVSSQLLTSNTMTHGRCSFTKSRARTSAALSRLTTQVPSSEFRTLRNSDLELWN